MCIQYFISWPPERFNQGLIVCSRYDNLTRPLHYLKTIKVEEILWCLLLMGPMAMHQLIHDCRPRYCVSQWLECKGSYSAIYSSKMLLKMSTTSQSPQPISSPSPEQFNPLSSPLPTSTPSPCDRKAVPKVPPSWSASV